MVTLGQALLVLAISTSLCQGQCPLEYTEQPPTTLSCSPYGDLNSKHEFRLGMECRAKQHGVNGIVSFDLSWYRKRSCDGMVENLGPGSRQENPGEENIDLAEVESLNSAPFSEEIPGSYWCQATITNSSGQYLSIESNVLTVLRPENYTGHSTCSSVVSVSRRKCAYTLTSSTCVMPCISETSIPTMCISPKSPMEENSTPTPVNLSPSSQLWNPSSPSSSTCSMSEGSSSDVQPASARSCILLTSPVKTLLTQIQNTSTVTLNTNTMSVGDSPSLVTLVMVVVVVMLTLISLLLAGTVITFFLRRKLKSKARPMKEQAGNELSEKKQQEEYDEVSPQAAYYEQIIPLEISSNPKAEAAPNSHELLSLQLVKNTAYGVAGGLKTKSNPDAIDNHFYASPHPNVPY